MSPALQHAQSQLAELRHELDAARAAGLAANPLYRRDLDEELAHAHAAYVAAAVTEIATLRAQLSGPLEG